jgi:phage terminase small subunit
MEMAKMMGLENEHNYIQGHVDRIASELKKEMEPGLMETIIELKKSNPKLTSKEVAEHIQEIKTLSEKKDSLCKRGKDYIKSRQAAGEKSSAYLSGRGVKVCKGQIEFKGKKINSYK